MTGITHEQARRYLNAAADDMLNQQERYLMEEHLRNCEACRAEADNLEALRKSLQESFQAHWDHQNKPAQLLFPTIQTRSRNFFLRERVTAGVRLLAGSVLALVLAVGLNYIIAQRQQVSSRLTSPTTLTLTPQLGINPTPVRQTSHHRLVAFASTESGNSEVYVLKEDGTGRINVTDHPAYDGNPVWSPDGSRLAFESDRNGNRNIYVLNLTDGGLTRLTPAGGNNVLNTWSPDGSTMLFRNDQNGRWQWYTVATNGLAAPHLIFADDFQRYIWSPDGTQIAYMTDSNGGSNSTPHIYVVNSDGSNRQPVPLPASFFMLEGGMSWASDGKSLFYQTTKCSNSGDGCGLPLSYSIYQASPGESKPVLAASWGGLIADYFVGKTGLTLIGTTIQPTINTGGIDTWQWIHINGKKITKLTQWKNLESNCQNPNERDYATTVGGFAGGGGLHEEILVMVKCAADAQTWVYSATVDGSKIIKLNKEPILGDVNFMEWTPDGEFLSYMANDPLGVSQFFVWDVQAAHQDPFTRPIPLSTPGGVIQPAVFNGGLEIALRSATPSAMLEPTVSVTSLPGDWIAFSSDRNGGSDIYLMKKDGSGLTNLTRSGGDAGPRWSPDGRSIAFANGQSNIYYDLYVMRADGSDRRSLAPLGESAAWSPDGNQLADYRASDPLKPEKGLIHVIHSDGSGLRSFPLDFRNEKIQQSFDLTRLRWAADGEHLQFLTLEQPYVQNDVRTDKWKIYQLNLKDSSLKVLVESKTQIEDWFGDESALTVITLEETGWQWTRFEGSKSTVLTTWQPEIGTQVCGFSRLSVIWSQDGKKMLIAVYCYDNTTWLFLADASGKQISALTMVALNNFQGLSWSPDGKSVVFSADLVAPGNIDLYLLDIQAALKDPATRALRLTTAGFTEMGPVWQPAP